MKRVCHLTTVHPPFDTRIFPKMCKSLVSAGFEVHLVVTHEKDETVDGVRLHALPKPKNRIERVMFSPKRCLRKAIKVDAELYHFHDPELLAIGLKLKSLGKKVVYDVHENHSGSMLDLGYMHPWLRVPIARRIKRLENLADGRLDSIISATPAIARQFSNPAAVTVQNFPLDDEFADFGSTPQTRRARQFAFVGGVTRIRAAKEMVEAIGLVEDATLVIGGHFAPSSLEDELATCPGWSQTKCLGWIDRDTMGGVLSESRAGLVLFLPARNHIEAQPNKIFEYMAAGLPLIASHFPLWKEIVEGEGVGLTVDPEDSQAIAEAMRWILDHPEEADEMGRRGKAAVRSKYCWSAQEKILVDLYNRLVD